MTKYNIYCVVIIDYEKNDLLFDLGEFKSVVYQRPFQYLFRQENKASLSDIDLSTPQGDPAQCLTTLLRLVL